MLYPDNEFTNDPNDQPKPNAYRVDDDDNNNADADEPREDDGTKPVTEGQPMGGHSFGENNVTHAGDDKNNPSQNAGYKNEYFRRTEPSEEHPENTNFTPDGDNTTREGTADNDGPKK